LKSVLTDDKTRLFTELPELQESDFDIITDNKSSPAAQSAFCAVSDFDHTSLGSNGTNSAVSCDDDDLEQTSIAVHPALYFFVVAQLLVGLGGSGILVLTTPYIDENAPQTKSALYLGISTFCQH